MVDLPKVVTNPSTNRARRRFDFVDVTNAVTAAPNQPPHQQSIKQRDFFTAPSIQGTERAT